MRSTVTWAQSSIDNGNVLSDSTICDEVLMILRNLFCGSKDFLDYKLSFCMEDMNLLHPKSECPSLLKDAES